MNKKGYVLVELQQGAIEKEFVKYIQDTYMTGRDYCCSVVGKFNVVIEKVFEELHEVDDLVTRIRNDPRITRHLSKTTTYIGTQYAR